MDASTNSRTIKNTVISFSHYHLTYCTTRPVSFFVKRREESLFLSGFLLWPKCGRDRRLAPS